jgi:integrase
MKRDDTVTTNPFAGVSITGSTTERDRVLTDAELVEIWHAASSTSLTYGAIVRFLLVSGQRKTEVAEMSWPEISADLATWTIPGARTKNGAPHIVPLSKPARAILRATLPDDDGEAERVLKDRRAKATLVFPGILGTPFAGWSKAKQALDAAVMKVRTERAEAEGAEAAPLEAWRLHDARRTLATGLQRLGVRLEVTEAVLNHLSGSRAGIVGVYQRHDWLDERRAALTAWGEHVTALVNGRTKNGNVVKLAFGT